MNSESQDALAVIDKPFGSMPDRSLSGKLAGTTPSRAVLQLGCLILGYTGIYLCRKNFAVALPGIQKSLGVTRAHVGLVETYATIAYAIGKVFWGPTIDRIGGRTCFLLALIGVTVFSGLTTFAATLPMLSLLYTASRFFGSGGWGGMVKQVPGWFPPARLPLAMAFLSLSFVFGGVCALMLAGQIAGATGDDWHAIMGFPALLLAVIVVICWTVLPRPASAGASSTSTKTGWRLATLLELAKIPQFWLVCSLSFVLTITRETFNVWTVDFLKTEGGAQLSSKIAALLSTPFDAAGAAGILLLGWVLGHLSPSKRNGLLFGMLTILAALIYVLPKLVSWPLWILVLAIGMIGFLSYGPYSLLAGILAVEIRGPKSVATVAGFVDASGYLAGIFVGYFFGKILDYGGYTLGFHCIGVTTLVAATLCLGLYRNPKTSTRAAMLA